MILLFLEKGKRGVKRKRDHSSEARGNIESLDTETKCRLFGETKMANFMKRYG